MNSEKLLVWALCILVVVNQLKCANIENRTKKYPYYVGEELFEGKESTSFTWPRESNYYGDEIGFWTVMGEKECVIGIHCSILHDGDCSETDAYVSVSDGSSGYEKFCGNISFKVRPSDSTLRDMFVKVHSPNETILANCSAKCDYHTDYKPLLKENTKKTDLRCVCGLQNTNDRIIGGQNAKMNEFPWQAVLVRKNTRNSGCGASLINDRFVLTARHCVRFGPRLLREKYEVLLHVHILAQADKPKVLPWEFVYQEMLEKTKRIQIAEVIAPVLKLRFKLDYDIVLLRLAEPIDLSEPDGPTPVCLPPENEHASYTDHLIGKMLTVTGWGVTETGNKSRILKKISVPYIADDECSKAVATFNKDSEKEHDFSKLTWNKTPRQMCAFFPNESVLNDSPCSGDSGNPLTFKKQNGQYVQVGVVSGGGDRYGNLCPIEGVISVFAKVSEMMQFIMYHSNAWGAKWCKDVDDN